MFLLPLGFPSMVDSIDLTTNAYLRYPRPNPPPPRTQASGHLPKDSYLNNAIIDIKNPLLNTLSLKNQLDQKEQSYYEILMSKLEFNNNEYVSNVLSDGATEQVVDYNDHQNICSTVERIVTNSSTAQSLSPNVLAPPIVPPPPPRLSSFTLDNIDVTNMGKDINTLMSYIALPPSVPEPPKRTHAHYLEPIFESLESEKHL